MINGLLKVFTVINFTIFSSNSYSVEDYEELLTFDEDVISGIDLSHLNNTDRYKVELLLSKIENTDSNKIKLEYLNEIYEIDGELLNLDVIGPTAECGIE